MHSRPDHLRSTEGIKHRENRYGNLKRTVGGRRGEIGWTGDYNIFDRCPDDNDNVRGEYIRSHVNKRIMTLLV